MIREIKRGILHKMKYLHMGITRSPDAIKKNDQKNVSKDTADKCSLKLNGPLKGRGWHHLN